MVVKTIKVMISSRCNDPFPDGGAPLTTLRKRIKSDLEDVKVFDNQLFEVWINETAPPAGTDQDSMDTCLSQVDEADIVIVLSNGNAGWAPNPSDLGICHAELMRGVSTAPGKVRLVSLGTIHDTKKDDAQSQRDAHFQKYLEDQVFFRGGAVRTTDEAVERVREAIFDALVSLTRLGVREARKGRYYTGEALAWSNLNFTDRQQRIVSTLTEAFAGRGGKQGDGRVVIDVAGEPVMFVIHGVPAALSVSSAREMIGRPFLRDFELAKDLTAAFGPVHIIGCQKTATEAQAMAFLGFPDATIVSAPFGVYVADPIQKVQFLFLQNCREGNSTRFAAQRFFDWLTQSSEDQALLKRAKARSRIVSAIAKEAG